MRLFHLSDDPAIPIFHPRPSDHTERPVVWAIAQERLANYLLPRDCPRVCFRAGAKVTPDAALLLGDDRAVIAIEAGWAERVATGVLHRYTMPPDGFVLQDANAGYWVSETSVTPLGVEPLPDLPAAIAALGVTLRVLPSLWDLHDAVVASGLEFSMIRMRNAAGRETALSHDASE